MEGEEFLRLMQVGDVRAWDILVPIIRQTTLGACRDLKMPFERWDDHVQDVVYKVFTNWKRYRGDSKLNTWVYSVARNACLDEKRRVRVRREVNETNLGLEEGASIFDSIVDREASNMDQMLCVQKILAQLEAMPAARRNSKRTIDVLRWCVENDPSTEELAAFFGTSEGAAKQRKSYMLQQIRQLCEEHCGDDECNFSLHNDEWDV